MSWLQFAEDPRTLAALLSPSIISTSHSLPLPSLSNFTPSSGNPNTLSALNPYTSPTLKTRTNRTSISYCLCSARFNASPFAHSGIFIRCSLSSIVSTFFFTTVTCAGTPGFTAGFTAGFAAGFTAGFTAGFSCFDDAYSATVGTTDCITTPLCSG